MPSISPRSLDTIMESIRTSAEDVNAAADILKGPLAVVVWSLANELARTEEFVGYLLDLYQFDNAERIEPADLYNLAANYGVDPDAGRSTRIQVYFYRWSRPEAGKVYPVDVGTTCGSQDGRFIYSSINYGQMDGNYADTYYNPDQRRYEIPVLVEAVNSGADYDLPPYTVVRILSALEDFDGCVNYDDPKRKGADRIDPIQLIRNLQNELQGVGSDIGGHVIAQLQAIDPTGYDDIAFVPSSDFQRFKRNKSLQGRLGYDVYVISDATEDYIQNGTARGGELKIPLDHSPVLAVSYVTVDGEPVVFTFEPETNPAVMGSPLGTYSVSLPDALLPLQSYQISYSYYDFVYQGYQSLQGRVTPFRTDTLVRLANPVEIYISGQASISSTGTRDAVIADLRTFTERYIRDPDTPGSTTRRFITILEPTSYVLAAISNVEGLTNLKLSGFVRLDSARLPVETIVFDGATEYPLLGPNFDIQ